MGEVTVPVPTAANNGAGCPALQLPPLSFSHQLRERADNLISKIRPASASEVRRNEVVQYMQAVITTCFDPIPVHALSFGSVPLKTYLPDGDIDLSIFCNYNDAAAIKDNWAQRLHAKLEEEQRSQSAPFTIGDIQVINAEVKLLKLLVDNIVVDVSYNQLGGLCALTFLEAIDMYAVPNHVFKRSIILVKAWCYYESRLLGAHHGLLSTYGLEALVLYIFNLYHRHITSPLEVLYLFMLEFSRFDWEQRCLSLHGPVPLTTFPDHQVEVPEPLAQDPLMTEEMMINCLSKVPAILLLGSSGGQLPGPGLGKVLGDTAQQQAAAGGAGGGAGGGNSNSAAGTPVAPQGQLQQARSFAIRSLNIMDPLLPSNNLGRSVSRANFLRIRRALAHGAACLEAIMRMDDPEAAVAALDLFFRNTWKAQHSAQQHPHQHTNALPGASGPGQNQGAQQPPQQQQSRASRAGQQGGRESTHSNPGDGVPTSGDIAAAAAALLASLQQPQHGLGHDSLSGRGQQHQQPGQPRMATVMNGRSAGDLHLNPALTQKVANARASGRTGGPTAGGAAGAGLGGAGVAPLQMQSMPTTPTSGSNAPSPTPGAGGHGHVGTEEQYLTAQALLAQAAAHAAALRVVQQQQQQQPQALALEQQHAAMVALGKKMMQQHQAQLQQQQQQQRMAQQHQHNLKPSISDAAVASERSAQAGVQGINLLEQPLVPPPSVISFPGFPQAAAAAAGGVSAGESEDALPPMQMAGGQAAVGSEAVGQDEGDRDRAAAETGAAPGDQQAGPRRPAVISIAQRSSGGGGEMPSLELGMGDLLLPPAVANLHRASAPSSSSGGARESQQAQGSFGGMHRPPAPLQTRQSANAADVSAFLSAARQPQSGGGATPIPRSASTSQLLTASSGSSGGGGSDSDSGLTACSQDQPTMFPLPPLPTAPLQQPLVGSAPAASHLLMPPSSAQLPPSYRGPQSPPVSAVEAASHFQLQQQQQQQLAQMQRLMQHPQLAASLMLQQLQISHGGHLPQRLGGMLQQPHNTLHHHHHLHPLHQQPPPHPNFQPHAPTSNKAPFHRRSASDLQLAATSTATETGLATRQRGLTEDNLSHEDRSAESVTSSNTGGTGPGSIPAVPPHPGTAAQPPHHPAQYLQLYQQFLGMLQQNLARQGVAPGVEQQQQLSSLVAAYQAYSHHLQLQAAAANAAAAAAGSCQGGGDAPTGSGSLASQPQAGQRVSAGAQRGPPAAGSQGQQGNRTGGGAGAQGPGPGQGQQLPPPPSQPHQQQQQQQQQQTVPGGAQRGQQGMPLQGVPQFMVPMPPGPHMHHPASALHHYYRAWLPPPDADRSLPLGHQQTLLPQLGPMGTFLPPPGMQGWQQPLQRWAGIPGSADLSHEPHRDGQQLSSSLGNSRATARRAGVSGVLPPHAPFLLRPHPHAMQGPEDMLAGDWDRLEKHLEVLKQCVSGSAGSESSANDTSAVLQALIPKRTRTDSSAGSAAPSPPPALGSSSNSLAGMVAGGTGSGQQQQLPRQAVHGGPPAGAPDATSQQPLLSMASAPEARGAKEAVGGGVLSTGSAPVPSSTEAQPRVSVGTDDSDNPATTQQQPQQWAPARSVSSSGVLGRSPAPFPVGTPPSGAGQHLLYGGQPLIGGMPGLGGSNGGALGVNPAAAAAAAVMRPGSIPGAMALPPSALMPGLMPLLIPGTMMLPIQGNGPSNGGGGGGGAGAGLDTPSQGMGASYSLGPPPLPLLLSGHTALAFPAQQPLEAATGVPLHVNMPLGLSVPLQPGAAAASGPVPHPHPPPPMGYMQMQGGPLQTGPVPGSLQQQGPASAGASVPHPLTPSSSVVVGAPAGTGVLPPAQPGSGHMGSGSFPLHSPGSTPPVLPGGVPTMGSLPSPTGPATPPVPAIATPPVPLQPPVAPAPPPPPPPPPAPPAAAALPAALALAGAPPPPAAPLQLPHGHAVSHAALVQQALAHAPGSGKLDFHAPLQPPVDHSAAHSPLATSPRGQYPAPQSTLYGQIAGSSDLIPQAPVPQGPSGSSSKANSTSGTSQRSTASRVAAAPAASQTSGPVSNLSSSQTTSGAGPFVEAPATSAPASAPQRSRGKAGGAPATTTGQHLGSEVAATTSAGGAASGSDQGVVVVEQRGAGGAPGSSSSNAAVLPRGLGPRGGGGQQPAPTECVNSSTGGIVSGGGAGTGDRDGVVGVNGNAAGAALPRRASTSGLPSHSGAFSYAGAVVRAPATHTVPPPPGIPPAGAGAFERPRGGGGGGGGGGGANSTSATAGPSSATTTTIPSSGRGHASGATAAPLVGASSSTTGGTAAGPALGTVTLAAVVAGTPVPSATPLTEALLQAHQELLLSGQVGSGAGAGAPGIVVPNGGGVCVNHSSHAGARTARTTGGGGSTPALSCSSTSGPPPASTTIMHSTLSSQTHVPSVPSSSTSPPHDDSGNAGAGSCATTAGAAVPAVNTKLQQQSLGQGSATAGPGSGGTGTLTQAPRAAPSYSAALRKISAVSEGVPSIRSGAGGSKGNGGPSSSSARQGGGPPPGLTTNRGSKSTASSDISSLSDFSSTTRVANGSHQGRRGGNSARAGSSSAGGNRGARSSGGVTPTRGTSERELDVHHAKGSGAASSRSGNKVVAAMAAAAAAVNGGVAPSSVAVKDSSVQPAASGSTGAVPTTPTRYVHPHHASRSPQANHNSSNSNAAGAGSGPSSGQGRSHWGGGAGRPHTPPTSPGANHHHGHHNSSASALSSPASTSTSWRAQEPGGDSAGGAGGAGAGAARTSKGWGSAGGGQHTQAQGATGTDQGASAGGAARTSTPPPSLAAIVMHGSSKAAAEAAAAAVVLPGQGSATSQGPKRTASCDLPPPQHHTASSSSSTRGGEGSGQRQSLDQRSSQDGRVKGQQGQGRPAQQQQQRVSSSSQQQQQSGRSRQAAGSDSGQSSRGRGH